jgi:ABC-type phosphate/phosphonate transport system substrate-binding protein
LSGAPASAALLACLGMYDFPWVADANDALWRGLAERLRAAGIEAPRELSRGIDLHDLWRDPRLIFGQTCGYPYVTMLRPHVRLIATPVYSHPGCEGAYHRSFLIARKAEGRRRLEDFAGARAAVNSFDSNSGMNLFRATIAPLAHGRAFFADVIVTGSHQASLAAIGAGEADIAALDCVSFALLAEGRPDLTDRVDIVAQSPLSPALPFVMSAGLATARLGEVCGALQATLADPTLAVARQALGIVGLQLLSDADYERVAEFEREATEAGYPTLA